MDVEHFFAKHVLAIVARVQENRGGRGSVGARDPQVRAGAEINGFVDEQGGGVAKFEGFIQGLSGGEIGVMQADDVEEGFGWGGFGGLGRENWRGCSGGGGCLL